MTHLTWQHEDVSLNTCQSHAEMQKRWLATQFWQLLAKHSQEATQLNDFVTPSQAESDSYDRRSSN